MFPSRSKSRIRIYHYHLQYHLQPLPPYIHFTLHTHAHLDLIVWLVFYPLFDFTIYALQVCMRCLPTYKLHISFISYRMRERRHTTIIALERIHKYHILRDLRGSYKGNSEFYFENPWKLWNNSWTKNLRHSAWLDHSIFQLLKIQKKAISSMVKGNMGKFES
jgi:hypothetical protein